MHLTVVLGASAVDLGVWRDAVSIAAVREPLRDLTHDDQPVLTTHLLLAAIESALEQLSGQLDLRGVNSLNGAVYDGSVKSAALDANHPVHDAFSGNAAPVPLTRWATVTFLGVLGELLDHDGSPAQQLGRTGAYWRTRWNLDCTVLPFLPLHLAAALSVAPGPRDLLVLHDDIDALILPSPDDMTATVIPDVNGKAARKLVRDKYANGRWGVLAHLALRFAPGGRDGVDDKRFAFIQPFGSSGSVRFEHGTVVDEFYDLRAITRCVFESQILAYKQATGTVAPTRIVLLTDEDNPVVPHILSAVFNRAVLRPLLPIATSVPGAAGYGAALVAASAGDMEKIHTLLERVSSARPRSSSSPTTPAASPTLNRTTSLNSLKLTTTPTSKRCPYPPPSPDLPNKVDEPPAPWLRVVNPAPTDMWETIIYAAMMPEFTRVRSLVDSGIADAFRAIF